MENPLLTADVAPVTGTEESEEKEIVFDPKKAQEELEKKIKESGKKKKKHSYSIEQLFSYLTGPKGKNFYARIISQLERVPTYVVNGKPLDTMAVSIDRFGKYIFLYNPVWFQTDCTKLEAVSIIEHECVHLVNSHIPRFADMMANSPESVHKQLEAVANLGMDCAVNSFLLDENAPLPKNEKGELAVIDPKQFEYPRGKASEWYITKMLKDIKVTHVNYCGGGGPGQSEDGEGKSGDQMADELQKKFEESGNGNHPWKDQLKDMNKEELEDLSTSMERQTKRIVKKAVEDNDKLSSQSRGTVPGKLQAAIDGILASIPIPWTQILRDMITSSINVSRKRYMGRPCRRKQSMGISPFPGKKNQAAYKLLHCIDTSGSMSDEDFMKGLTVSADLMKCNSDIHVDVLEFDYGIESVYSLKDGVRTPKMTRSGYGGTSFNEPFEYWQDHDHDMIIMFTDGYAPEPRHDVRVFNKPVLWVFVEGGSDPCPDYGTKMWMQDI